MIQGATLCAELGLGSQVARAGLVTDREQMAEYAHWRVNGNTGLVEPRGSI